MTAFISHSEKDEGVVSALRAGLTGQSVATWNPASMGAGASLKNQLREAINSCDVCIFYATQSSLKDSWCMAHIGAFWGAGKPVIAFIADPEVDETKLPPQLQGDLWTSNFEKVVQDVQKILLEANDRRRQETARRPRKVSEMTIALLYDALASLRSTDLDKLPVGEAMRLIQENICNDLADVETMQPLINRLVGVPQVFIEEAAGKYWPTAFTLTTPTGAWLGFAKKFTSYQLIDEYSNCLLVFFENKSCVAATAAGTVVVREGQIKFDGLVENPGLISLGEPLQLMAKGDA